MGRAASATLTLVAFIDSTYIDNAITTQTHSALTGGSSNVDNQYIALACAKVVECARRAGYATLTAATVLTPYPESQPVLQACALFVYVKMAKSMRRSVTIPKDVLAFMIDPDGFATGAVVLPDFPQDSAGAPGGAFVKNGGTASAPTTTRDPIMSVSRLANYP